MKSLFLPICKNQPILENWKDLLKHYIETIPVQKRTKIKVWISPSQKYSLSDFEMFKDLGLEVEVIPLLSAFVEEGFVDSVEFRRLARRFFRPSKAANVTDFIFFDWIDLSSKERKIIQNMAGKKITVHFEGWHGER